jgi:hypothetical protein
MIGTAVAVEDLRNNLEILRKTERISEKEERQTMACANLVKLLFENHPKGTKLLPPLLFNTMQLLARTSKNLYRTPQAPDFL